jgi:hypothetical protein
MWVLFTKQQNCTYSVVVTRSVGEACAKRNRVKLQFQGVGKKFLLPQF